VAPRLIRVGVIVISLMLFFPLMDALLSGRIADFMLGVGVLLVVLWTLLARDSWWLLVPAFVAFGGFFHFGFKVLAHEAALISCLLALVVALLVDRTPREVHSRVPQSACWLIAYMIVHFGVSAYLMKSDQLPGIGRVGRVYMHGLWPLLFLVPFHLYGKTALLRKTFIIVYWVTVFRVTLGAVSYFYPALVYLPGVNLFLPTTLSGALDLRGSALLFTSLNLCYFLMVRSRVRKAIHFLLIAGSGVLCLLGSGRGPFLVFCTLPLILGLLRRRLIFLFCALASLGTVVLLLNRSPDVLYSLPAPAKRALSVLILDRPTHDLHRADMLSIMWHFELGKRAFQKWTASAFSFAFGNRVYAYSEEAVAGSRGFGAMADEAARTGAYEAGLWTILAVTGIVGLVLYILLFGRLLRGLAEQIRLHGIPDYAHAAYFLAVSSALVWVVFCWIMGHFPSADLMWAVIAHKVYEAERQKTTRAG